MPKIKKDTSIDGLSGQIITTPYIKESIQELDTSLYNTNIEIAKQNSVRTVNSDTVLTATDGTILVDTGERDVTITLFTAVGFEREVTIKKISPLNIINVNTVLSQTIDGHESMIISFNNSAMTLKSNNLNWFIK